MINIKHVQKLFCLTCAYLLLVSYADIAQSSPRIHPVFQSILPALERKTLVPIVLPTYIPSETSDGTSKLYANVTSLTQKGYTIILGYTSDCEGGNACRFETISGVALTPITPPLTAESEDFNDRDPRYKPMVRSAEKPGFITLALGVTGYFVPYTCGAFCSDAKLFWERNGYRYMLGVKAANSKVLVDMANSAIINDN